jgi:NAD(P)-dependent dehydrogenase (short-subunit alcohol dehydrogenase family)
MTILGAFSLDGKVAIVTGASSGLGVAFATGMVVQKNVPGGVLCSGRAAND